MQTQPQVLEYGPKAGGIRRSWVKRLVVLAVVGALLLIAKPWAKRAWRFVDASFEIRTWQTACLQYTAPPAKIIFDESEGRPPVGLAGPTRASATQFRSTRQGAPIDRKTAHDPAGHVGPPGTYGTGRWDDRPECLWQLWNAGYRFYGHGWCAYGLGPAYEYDPKWGTVYAYRGNGWSHIEDMYRLLCFLCSLRSPTGRQRLVALSFDGGAFIWSDPNPFWVSIMDAGWPTEPVWKPYRKIADFTFTCPLDKPLRLFAGQPDTADASHFTVEYTAGGVQGIIVGWLKDDDTIKLQIRP